ncbi:hypothetical protein GCM10008090_11350 [Arenicella chitinivorans]|uniref:Acyltransferase n=1 Tax=Arenicella chitinivorans TaxID=1329800 RepID=A0A918VJF2_9GAMM|nr:MBOAT family O-acyltransferase [Arenicella chitinivorans]GHA03839.1 hypothetical protein GCM10008090_11350 [Arenicella chitinivorans]
MRRVTTLSEYVRRRNGLALGAQGSLQAMLYRAFGAGRFSEFWHYWNPIWGYYLARYVMRPLSSYCPSPVAIVMTFVVSGALHDLAIMLLKWRVSVFFSFWFFLMGLLVVITEAVEVRYHTRPWWLRGTINLSFVLLPLALTQWVLG